MIILLFGFSISCSDKSQPVVAPYVLPAVTYVTHLVHPETGLVSSREGECYTTVYKNALAAMVFIHEGNRKATEGIFNVYHNYFLTHANNFTGLPKDWNACTGAPDGLNFWEGDSAFLLMALNYYRKSTGDSIKYISLSQNMVSWLLTRSDHCNEIVAEGVANMYAALKPFEYDPTVKSGLTKLRNCFFATGQTSSVSYPNVLDHTVRGSLVFGDETGFDYLPNFKRTETWTYNQQPVSAYSAFTGDTFINVEISAQLLLAATVVVRSGQVPVLQTELEKLWLPGAGSTKSSGLPYFITNIGFDQSATLPIIDPTAYMLFLYWKWNPWSPGKKCSDC
jgi:hypothetical protein